MRYLEQGAIKGLETGDFDASAEIVSPKGKTYEVNFNWEESHLGRAIARCTCRRYWKGELCGHIWATLLAVDELTGIEPDVANASLEVLHEFDCYQEPWAPEPSDTQDGGDEDHLEEEPADFQGRGQGRLAFRRDSDAPLPAWRVTLERIGRTTAEVLEAEDHARRRWRLRDREAWFLLHVQASSERGELVICFRERERRQGGQWGKIRRLLVSRHRMPEFVHPEDGELLELLLGCESEGASASRYDLESPPWFGRCVVPPALYEMLLPRLCQTGRFVWRPDPSLPLEQAPPVVWDGGDPWRFRLQFETDTESQQWRISGQLHRGDQSLPLADAVMLLPTGLVLFPQGLARLDALGDFGWICYLHGGRVLEVPFADRTQFLRALSAHPRLPQADWPPELRAETVVGAPRGCLQIHAPAGPGRFYRETLYGNVLFEYSGQAFAPDDFRAGTYDEASGRIVLRNPEQERALTRQLAKANVHPMDAAISQLGKYELSKKRLTEIIYQLLAAGWKVESEGNLVRWPGTPRFSVRSHIDWFELEGQVDFDGWQVPLPRLLEAVRQNQRYVVLDDGSQGLLPEEWLRRYGDLAELAELSEGDGTRLKFRPTQAMLLDAMLAEQQHVEVDQSFAEFRRKLAAFDGIRPEGEPAGFRGELRDYQREGLGWLQFLCRFGFGGCLADDMGLGKTVQVLAFLEARRQQAAEGSGPSAPSLVVVPKSLVFNWLEEAERFTPHLRVINYTGTDRKQQLRDSPGYDLLLTTYGTLRNDIGALREIRFDCVILDEAQAIKNQHSQAAKASRLLTAAHRLTLTGTPVENHLGELWSLFEFLNPGMLGRAAAFEALARNSGQAHPESLALLAKALRPFLLRRTKEQVLRELPEKTEQTVYCEMPPRERKKYDELRDYYRAHLSQQLQALGLQKAKIHVLEALLRLRQAACHLGLLDPRMAGESSAKLEILLERLSQVMEEGHKALVFSQFTSLLAIVRKHLEKRKIVYEYLDGSTPDRGAHVQRFQEDPRCPLFLISLKAGGHGLNLTAADYVFILDPWWNPAVEAQAIDRTHRIGQTRRVFAYRLICKDTVEDKILELQKTKRELADAILTADHSLIRQLTAEDLQLLLS